MSISSEVTMLLLFAICGVTFIVAACISIWILVGILKILFVADPEYSDQPSQNIGGVGFMISQQRSGNPQFPSAAYPQNPRKY